ncbi:DUF7373 family lipoprotein [Pseudonocardia lacus]|uniref:DUF7373 family lipoprotein n=1 Tax=Pseudonocardia lacus TaxID=2835865 RepID=UPI001BDC878B|nr:hypothetical protein [Pseudonocardia lacus]
MLGVLVLLSIAACSTTVPGRATAALPRDGEPPLNAAPAPPDPEDIIQAPEDGRSLEAHRIAAATPIIPAIFPDRTEYCFPEGAFFSTEAIEGLYFTEGTAKPILDKYGFASGWGECQQDVDDRGTLALSVELSDPASARAAADELAKAGQDFDERTSTVLDGYPVQTSSDATNDTVEIWAPVGRMLAYVYHTAPSGQALDGATRLITEHTRLLEAFTPTPQAELPNLPIDPAGLIPRIVKLPGEIQKGTGPYELEAYLRLAIDAKAERDLLADNGFESMYYVTSGDEENSYSVSLYKFPGSAQTNVVYDGFARLEEEAFGGTPFELPSIPDAPCFVFDGGYAGTPSFYQRCYVGFGGYLASVDVGGLDAADDTAKMDELLPEQRDLIRG